VAKTSDRMALLMTGDERFSLIWRKIERANKHIRDLNAAKASLAEAKLEIFMAESELSKKTVAVEMR